jgi:hypothetical protein
VVTKTKKVGTVAQRARAVTQAVSGGSASSASSESVKTAKFAPKSASPASSHQPPAKVSPAVSPAVDSKPGSSQAPKKVASLGAKIAFNPSMMMPGGNHILYISLIICDLYIAVTLLRPTKARHGSCCCASGCRRSFSHCSCITNPN